MSEKPWTLHPQDWRVVENADGEVVADVRAPSGTVARLIAAAPEMYEMLREDYEASEGPGETDRPYYQRLRELFKRINGDA